MKIWEKTKEFCKKHKTGIITALSCIGTFAGGMVLMRKIDCMIVDEAINRKIDEINEQLISECGDGIRSTFEDSLDASFESFEKEQEELRNKYSADFEIMENTVKNMQSPTIGKLWIIENGNVALIDGIIANEE